MSTDVPLPPILDPERRKRVFSHKGMPLDNTRFALLGSTLLMTVATCYKLAQYPDAGTGQITTERSTIVREKATASYAVHYGLEKQLKARENEEQVRKIPSVQASLFEAYVAAVFIESDFDFNLVRNWLFALWDLMATNPE